MVALSTLFLVALRTYYNTLDSQLRDFYTFFWDNDKVSKGRKIISFEGYLDEMIPYLDTLNKGEHISIPNKSSDSDVQNFVRITDNIEAIDAFFASISRATLHGVIKLHSRHQQAYERIFVDYWLDYIIGIPTLRDYYFKHWVEPLGVSKSIDEYNAIMKIRLGRGYRIREFFCGLLGCNSILKYKKNLSKNEISTNDTEYNI